MKWLPVLVLLAGASPVSAGIVTGASSVIFISTASGSAGGDLTGTYPNPTIATDSVETTKIAADGVTNSELLNDAGSLSKVTDRLASASRALGITVSTQITSNSSMTITGAGGYIKTSSSITASAFVGDGTGITNVLLLNSTQTVTAAKTTSSQVNISTPGSLTLTNSSMTLSGAGGTITSASSVNASGFFGVLRGSDITALTIDSTKLGAASVDVEKLVNLTINSAKIGVLSVDSEKLAAGAVNAEKIQALTIDSSKLGALSVNVEKMVALSVNSGKIAALSIDSEKLAAGAVNAEKIQSLVVDSTKLGAASVDVEKLTNTFIPIKTKANIDALTGVVGKPVLVSDFIVPYTLCIGTGTGTSDYRVLLPTGTYATGATQGCGTGL